MEEVLVSEKKKKNISNYGYNTVFLLSLLISIWILHSQVQTNQREVNDT